MRGNLVAFVISILDAFRLVFVIYAAPVIPIYKSCTLRGERKHKRRGFLKLTEEKGSFGASSKQGFADIVSRKVTR